MGENIVYKTCRAEIRGVDSETGVIDMMIPVSTASEDRDGEIIELGAWKKTLKPFKKRPILVASHDYGDLRSQIGEFVKLEVGADGFLASPKYYIGQGNEQADWAFKLAGWKVAAFSVGFKPLDWENDEIEIDGHKRTRRRYTNVELYEISQVVVPSNRDAIQAMIAKGIADPVAKAIAAEAITLEEIVTKPEETDQYFRVPVAGEEGKHGEHRIRTNDGMSQTAIADELDYCLDMIQNQVIELETRQMAEKLALAICGLTGVGIRLEDKESLIGMKTGAVLNAKNKRNLTDAQGLIQQVLDSAEPVTESADPPVESISQEVIAQAVVEAMKRYIQI